MEKKTNRNLILAASCFVVLCVGSLYAWSVFAGPMAEHLSALTGKQIASLAIVFTVANAVGPITMISGGAINDKLGPKLVLLIGAVLFGLGMIGAGFCKSVAALVVCYGLGVGLGNGMIYGTIVSNAVKFFPDKAGFVGGLTTACYGGSSILIPPLANALMQRMGVTSAFKLLGTAMLVILIAAAFVMQKAPESAPKQAASGQRELSWREMIREKSFTLMLLTLLCGAFAGMMLISQAAVIAKNMMGFTAAAAAAVVSLLALFNTLGRLAAGTLSDRFGAVGTLRVTFAASALAGVLLFLCKEGAPVLFYAGLALTGFSFGSIMGIYPGFTAAQFGRKNNSVNYGIMFIGFALAGLFGPSLMNLLHGMTGRYQPAFLASAALALVGEVLLALMKKQEKQG